MKNNFRTTPQRNAQREGKANIPEVGVKATFRKLQIPNITEGFDELFTVKLIENNGFSIHATTTD